MLWRCILLRIISRGKSINLIKNLYFVCGSTFITLFILVYEEWIHIQLLFFINLFLFHTTIPLRSLAAIFFIQVQTFWRFQFCFPFFFSIIFLNFQWWEILLGYMDKDVFFLEFFLTPLAESSNTPINLFTSELGILFSGILTLFFLPPFDLEVFESEIVDLRKGDHVVNILKFFLLNFFLMNCFWDSIILGYC